jgi:hypothetical protein
MVGACRSLQAPANLVLNAAACCCLWLPLFSREREPEVRFWARSADPSRPSASLPYEGRDGATILPGGGGSGSPLLQGEGLGVRSVPYIGSPFAFLMTPA